MKIRVEDAADDQLVSTIERYLRLRPQLSAQQKEIMSALLHEIAKRLSMEIGEKP